MLSSIKSLRDERHIDKVFYLGVSEKFYERNYTHYVPSDELFEIVESIVASYDSNWTLHRSDVWTHVIPGIENEGFTKLIVQGWKIHVSATNLNCKNILKAVADLAISRCVQFKFANDTETLRLMTSKRWSRGGSGKFITVYPSSDDAFREFLELAHAALREFSGSYILSDRRFKDSRCLYYRYGGVQLTSRLDWLGAKREFLTSPEGEEISDKRGASFEMPYWVTDPFPEEEDEQDGDITLNNGRYTVKSALAFSNTGGVYLATDNETGKQVVIKESRPGVELAKNGQDATKRLAQEAMILESAKETGVVPVVHGTFWDWENFYLVEEYLDADDMRGIMLEHTPLLLINPTKAHSEKFYGIFKNLFLGLLGAINKLHRANVVVGDLSPTNIMVEKATDMVRIIDLEGAFRPSLDEPQDIHTPGFRADSANRKKASDYDDDLYAIGVIMMYAMFPIGAMAYVRKDVFTNVLPVLVRDIGWEGTPVMDLVRRLIANDISSEDAIKALEAGAEIQAPFSQLGDKAPHFNLERLCTGLAGFITANYRIDPVYSLFPIDPFGQLTNPLGLYFGATGIIYALRASGFDVPDEAMARYHAELEALELDKLPPGLLNGKAGMAWGLLEMGDVDAGRRLLDSANADPLTFANQSLYYGMAGVGLANLAAYHRLQDDRYLNMALQLAEVLSASAKRDERGTYWDDNGNIRIGYGYGQSGVALFLLRLSQMAGEPKWRELGQSALEYDLSFGVEFEAGTISFGDAPDQTETLEQYIEQGSGGIAKVAIRYGLWDRLDGLLADVHRKYSCFAGLIYGLSGFVDVLIDAYIYSKDDKYLKMINRPLEGIVDLYIFETEEGFATPGENLFRISCDYASGTAGIIQTLYRRINLTPDKFCLDALDNLAVP